MNFRAVTPLLVLIVTFQIVGCGGGGDADKMRAINILSGHRYFRRDGQTLNVYLRSKKILALRSSPDQDDPKGKWYYYERYLKDIDHHLINVCFFEGNEYLLVNDRTGEKCTIQDEPHVSPGKKYIAVASAAEAFNPAGVWIYSIANGNRIKPEYSCESKYGLFTFNKWESDESVCLTTSRWSEAAGAHIYVPVKLILRNGKWQFWLSEENAKNIENGVLCP